MPGAPDRIPGELEALDRGGLRRRLETIGAVLPTAADREPRTGLSHEGPFPR